MSRWHRTQKRSKHNVDLSDEAKAERTLEGEEYASGAEAHHAQQLIYQRKAGLLRFLPHPYFPLIVGATGGLYKVGTGYTADFLVVRADGVIEVHDVKGRVERDFPLRRDLFCALYGYPLVTYVYEKTRRGEYVLATRRVYAAKPFKKETPFQAKEAARIAAFLQS